MATPTDPFDRFRERLDPSVAVNLSGWAVDLVSAAVIEDDRTLERWAGAASEADMQVLEGLGERLSRWTAEDSASAGFALAASDPQPLTIDSQWFRGYRAVLGDHLSSEISAQAAYRAAQVAAAGETTARTWAADNMAMTERGPVPVIFAGFEAERVAAERAARQIAAVRELQSRELGITVGPVRGPDFDASTADPYHPDFYPEPPLTDVEVAMRRSSGALGALGRRRQRFEINAESIIESLGASDLESLDALQARLSGVVSKSAADAAEGHLIVPAGVAESLRLEREQKVAAQRHFEAMKTAGELYWDGPGPSDPVLRRKSYERATVTARREREAADRIERTLKEQRAEGRDAGTWFAGAEHDGVMRGFAFHVTRTELEIERGREAEGPGSGPDLGF